MNGPGAARQPDEIERIKSLGGGVDAVFAAENVDGMISSTRFVLLLQIGKARLLLPGDAEWSTWTRILEDEQSRAMLRCATFFKVGPNGSHNATSKTLIEKVLPKKIPAMISTQEGPGNYRNNIPLKELLDALDEHRIDYARSDSEEAELSDRFQVGEASKWINIEVLW